MSYAMWAALFGLAMLWGGAFVFVGYALDYLDPLAVVALRVSLAAPVLWVVVLLKQIALPRSSWIWLGFIALGVINNAVPFYLITWGQQHIDSGLASLLNGATPMFGAILAHFLTEDEKLSLTKIAGLVLGFVGVALLMQPSVVVSMDALLGQLAVLGGALSYAFAGMVGKRLRNVPPMMTATGQLTASSLILLPTCYLSGGFATATWSPSLWMVLAALAVASTAIAYLLYFTLIKQAGATNAMTVTLLIPLFATVMGMVWLGERPTMISWVSMVLILTGVGLVVRGGRRKVLRAPAKGTI
ncbi:DMT family transporter [Aestuariispira ectoiniformans]|uniref:DMT family transporter n=1 Tax=Aestuariispira ectoiniformans TaxID=2775080 RepID=UPI00223AF6A0|nr:DMT family transporter [Aestuariispira ectoiniformans]